MSSELVHLKGHDHASLALLPFGITGDRRSEPVTIAYQAQVDGKLRRINVTLRPGARSELPTPGDQTVFLALLQFTLRHGTSNRVEFIIHDLIQELGIAGSGTNYTRLREALDRLQQTSITVESELVARDGRTYGRSTEAVHIVDAYKLNDARHGERSWVEWGYLVRQAFELGDVKRLDWELVKALGNPLTSQLYRLLDRVTLAGEKSWEIGWKPLAEALGLSHGAYSRPARFKQVLEPHIQALVDKDVMESYEYARGGKFIFHVRNYTRARLREILVEMGVYPEAARQLVAGHDAPDIMVQADCLQHGSRPNASAPAGYLFRAVQEGYELRYPDEEPEAFLGIWGMLSAGERKAFHQAGLKLCGVGDDLFATREDPAAWPLELRAVVRFLICRNLDPDEVLRAA